MLALESTRGAGCAWALRSRWGLCGMGSLLAWPFQNGEYRSINTRSHDLGAQQPGSVREATWDPKVAAGSFISQTSPGSWLSLCLFSPIPREEVESSRREKNRKEHSDVLGLCHPQVQSTHKVANILYLLEPSVCRVFAHATVPLPRVGLLPPRNPWVNRHLISREARRRGAELR